jgi:putative ABC transport system permease protein
LGLFEIRNPKSAIRNQLYSLFMKFAGLVLKSTLRNKRRTILTVLGLGASLFLLVTLHTVLYELQATTITAESDLRLITRHAVSIANWLPLAYKEQIRQIPGVKDVMTAHWFGGIYIDESNFFPQFAEDADKTFRLYSELRIDPAQRETFERERTAAVAGARLCKRFGWKIGDRITLKGTFFPFDVELKLAGSFTSPNLPDEAMLVFHYDYLNEMMVKTMRTRDVAGFYIIQAESIEAVPRIAQAVDEKFRNSTAPTKTETEKAFQLSFSSMLGNVKLFIGAISAVVVFAILLVTAATMAMTIRERTAEVAILKTLGYTSGLVFTLLLAEALSIAMLGGLLGCGGAKLLYSTVDLQQLTGGWIVQLRVQPEGLALGMVLAAVIGAAASAVPAFRACRMPIAEALRHVG